DLGGALEENCGPHLTAVLLTDGSQVCIVYDSRPEAVPCAALAFPSLRRFLTRRTCLLAPGKTSAAAMLTFTSSPSIAPLPPVSICCLRQSRSDHKSHPERTVATTA